MKKEYGLDDLEINSKSDESESTNAEPVGVTQVADETVEIEEKV